MNRSISRRLCAVGASIAVMVTVAAPNGSAAARLGSSAPAGTVSPAVVSPNPGAPLCQLALSKIELYRNTSGFVAPDQLTLLDQTTTVDLDNLNLYQAPFDDDPSRKMWYRSLLWLAVAAVDAGERGDRATADTYAQKMVAAAEKYPDPGSANPFALDVSLAYGWDASTVIRRSQALLCLSAYTGVEPVRALLRMHADALIDPERYGGPPKRRVSNAGAFANLTLLEIGKAIDDPEYRRIAVQRLIDDNSAAFDDAGWSNEAAAHYQSVNIRLWRDVQAELRARGQFSEADALEARLAAATRLAGQLIGPAGQLATIGNTRPDDAVLRPGSSGLPLQLVDAPGGLAIGRWSWSDARTTWYTLQNRLVRGAHGHEDNLALTWATAGLQILADPGQPDYDRVTNPVTIWSMSPQAHNRSVPIETAKDRDRVRSLTVDRDGSLDDASMFTSDQGSLQARRVLIDDKRRAIEVTDRATMDQTQYWHLGAGWRVTSNSRATVVLRHTSGKELLVSSPEGSIEALPGALQPIAGLLVTGFEQVVPALELQIRGGKGLTTIMALVTPKTMIPTTPDISRESLVGDNFVDLIWTERSPKEGKRNAGRTTDATKTAGASGYRIQAYTRESGWNTVVADTDSTSTRKRIRKLANGTTYRFRVAPLTKKTVGTYSEPSRKLTPVGAPGAITEPVGKLTDKKRLTVSWTAPEDDGGAVVRYYEVALPKGKEPSRVKRPTVTVPLTRSRAVLSVTAVNRVGTGRTTKLVAVVGKDGNVKVRS